MQISLRLILSINHAKLTMCIRFQLLVTFSSLVTGSSSLSVFLWGVLFLLSILQFLKFFDSWFLDESITWGPTNRHTHLQRCADAFRNQGEPVRCEPNNERTKPNSYILPGAKIVQICKRSKVSFVKGYANSFFLSFFFWSVFAFILLILRRFSIHLSRPRLIASFTVFIFEKEEKNQKRN